MKNNEGLKILMKKWLLICLCGMLMWTGTTAGAEEIEQEEFINGTVVYEEGPHAQELVPGESGDADPIVGASVSDAKFDPRTMSVGYTLPAIRHQGQYGTCWAHSAVCCMEINLIKKGMANELINLSELQTAYYVSYMRPEWADPLGGLAGDGYWFYDLENGKKFLNYGCNQGDAANAWADWKGLSGEAPEWIYNSTNGDALIAAAESGNYGAYGQAGAYQNNVAHLVNYRLIPTANRDAVKQAVLTYGALAITYHDSSDTAIWNVAKSALYHPNPVTTTADYNHAVTVVGWDDTYAASNFSTTPQGPGAWIVRNSWGSGWADGGYFYISYYDMSIYKDGYAFEATLAAGDYQHNYQYDGARQAVSVWQEKAANIFQVKGDSLQTLEAVWFETAQSSLKYTIKVYKDLTDLQNPECGTLVATKTGRTDYVGYYRIALDNKVNMQSGDIFSVVVDLDTDSSVSCGFTLDYIRNTNTDTKRTFQMNINAGESFIYRNGAWRDMTTLTPSSDGKYGNARIKAFTNDATSGSYVAVSEVKLDAASMTLKKGEKAKLNGSVLPKNASHQSVWYVSGNEAVAKVDANGNITAVAAGTATITVYDYLKEKSASCVVNVTQSVEKVTISVTSKSLTVGDTMQATATVLPENAVNKTVTWSSDDTSVIKVDSKGKVTALKAGSTQLRATADGAYDIVKITVNDVSVQSVSVNWGDIRNMTVGESKKLTATVLPENATNATVTWSSSNESIATIKGDILTAVAEGTVAITAKAGSSYSSCSVSSTITIKKKTQQNGNGNGNQDQTVITNNNTGTGTNTIINTNTNTNTNTNKNQNGNSGANQQENLSPVEAFCARMYTVALGRKYDEGGLKYWAEKLKSHEINGAGIAHGFIMSGEFQKRGYSDSEYVDVLYLTFFNRKADEAGKNDWLNRLRQGATRAYVLQGFVNSVEFDKLSADFGIIRGDMMEDGSPAREGVDGFVQRLYLKTLNRVYDDTGLKDWSDKIRSGKMSLEKVAKDFFGSVEFQQRGLSDNEYVEVLYQTFLDRSSSAAERSDWLSKLKSGEYTREKVLEGFSQSGEFKKIAAGYGL